MKVIVTVGSTVKIPKAGKKDEFDEYKHGDILELENDYAKKLINSGTVIKQDPKKPVKKKEGE